MSFDREINLSISDWGIEETNNYRVFKNTTSINELFSKFIRKYLSLNNVNNEFWERFKYNLIVSNLLDDSMILSKNEQSLNNLMNNPSVGDKDYELVVNNNREYKLVICERKFALRLKNFNLSLVLTLVNLIIYLLKNQNRHTREENLNLFKLLLIISVKLIKYNKIIIEVESKKNLNHLNKFLIFNYKINKKLIVNLINLKNFKILNNQNQFLFFKLKRTLDNSLSFLIFNLRFAILKLLPYLNGEIFEKYCTINNINLDIISEEEEGEEVTENGIKINDTQDQKLDKQINKIIIKLKKFNQLRKFLICQLLTFNEIPSSNFFLNKIKNQVNLINFKKVYLNNFKKLLLIEEVFKIHNKILSSFHLIFENFEDLNQNYNTNFEMVNNNKDILTLTNTINNSDINLNNLINKLSSLTTNIKFFKKYNLSTSNNSEELNEKLLIFSQFNDELNQIKELYKLNLNDLNNELYKYNQQFSQISFTSTYSNNDFNPKSFHTSSIKKRNSLPSQHSMFKTPVSSPSQINSNEPDSSTNKKYKRLSTGLQLGLLTVFEEPPKKTAQESVDKRSISYDDNYINILPPTNYEAYNQLTLDKLQNNATNVDAYVNSRFSVNSMTSNLSGLSDLINLTHVTSIEDDNSSSELLTRQQLKSKLEENFNKMYHIEVEAKDNGSEIDTEIYHNENSNHQNNNHQNNSHLNENAINKSFLNELDKTLSNKVSN